MKIIKLLLLFVLLLLIGVFGAHNAEMVKINFYPFTLEIYVATFLLFFVSMLIGVILCGLVTSVKIIKLKKLLKRTTREKEKLAAELETLKAKDLKIEYHN